jgi:hypothetical protein
MKIKTFDRNTVSTLRQELEAAIAAVCEKHGVKSTTLGGIRFTDSSFTTGKLTVSVKEDGPSISTVDINTLIGNRYKYGQRTFTIKSANIDGTVSGQTNRGAMFKIRLDQLETMTKL